jgi:hypothetical protein
MGDTFTEVTHTSWFSRIGASIKGLLFGILFIVVGVCLLFWNEGRAVKTHKALVESQGLVVSINAQEAAPQMNGKLVHLTGEATTAQTLSDNLLPVSVHALKLQRQVETYQWEETSHSEEKKNMGGDTETVTTYSYEKVWSRQHISSSDFKQPRGHENPEKWRYKSEIWTADTINIGQYQLSETHKNDITDFQTLTLQNNIVLPKGVVRNSDGFYYGKDEKNPKIGDQQISFSYIPIQIYSVIGDLADTILTEHITSNGRSVALLQAGTHTADAMFEKAKNDNPHLGDQVGRLHIVDKRIRNDIKTLIGPGRYCSNFWQYRRDRYRYCQFFTWHNFGVTHYQYCMDFLSSAGGAGTPGLRRGISISIETKIRESRRAAAAGEQGWRTSKLR